MAEMEDVDPESRVQLEIELEYGTGDLDPLVSHTELSEPDVISSEPELPQPTQAIKIATPTLIVLDDECVDDPLQLTPRLDVSFEPSPSLSIEKEEIEKEEEKEEGDEEDENNDNSIFTPPLVVVDRRRKRKRGPSLERRESKHHRTIIGLADIAEERKKLEKQTFVNVHTPIYTAEQIPLPSLDRSEPFVETESKWEESYYLPKNWPPEITYTNVPIWPTLTSELNFNRLPFGSYLTTHTVISRVTTQNHPAFGQYGLFAAVDIPAGFILGEYTGVVKPQNHDQYDPSRYLFSIYDQYSDKYFDIDAEAVGNETRFINDFRQTGRQKNVEFRHIVLRHRKMILVQTCKPIKKHQEILCDYGKEYWSCPDARRQGENEEKRETEPFSIEGDPAQQIEFLDNEEDRMQFMKSWEQNLRERESLQKEREKLVGRWMDIFQAIHGSVSYSLLPFQSLSCFPL